MSPHKQIMAIGYGEENIHVPQQGGDDQEAEEGGDDQGDYS